MRGIELDANTPFTEASNDAGLPVAPNRRVYLFIRYTAERCLAGALLIVLLPLIGCLGVLVKFASDGPAFYSQTRLGLRGRRFQIYKLRTMTHNCEAATGPVWATVNDRRATGVGRILRDMHLDELPQLWNILRGEMSLVGPRPERPEIATVIQNVLPNFPQRLCVKPGLTGLAQMRSPLNDDLERVCEKLSKDLYYIENVGMILDLKIVTATAFHCVAAACGCFSKMLLNSTQQERRTAMEPQTPLEAYRTEVVADDSPLEMAA